MEEGDGPPWWTPGILTARPTLSLSFVPWVMDPPSTPGNDESNERELAIYHEEQGVLHALHESQRDLVPPDDVMDHASVYDMVDAPLASEDRLYHAPVQVRNLSNGALNDTATVPIRVHPWLAPDTDAREGQMQGNVLIATAALGIAPDSVHHRANEYFSARSNGMLDAFAYHTAALPMPGKKRMEETAPSSSPQPARKKQAVASKTMDKPVPPVPTVASHLLPLMNYSSAQRRGLADVMFKNMGPEGLAYPSPSHPGFARVIGAFHVCLRHGYWQHYWNKTRAYPQPTHLTSIVPNESFAETLRNALDETASDPLAPKASKISKVFAHIKNPADADEFTWFRVLLAVAVWTLRLFVAVPVAGPAVTTTVDAMDEDDGDMSLFGGGATKVVQTTTTTTVQPVVCISHVRLSKLFTTWVPVGKPYEFFESFRTRRMLSTTMPESIPAAQLLLDDFMTQACAVMLADVNATRRADGDPAVVKKNAKFYDLDKDMTAAQKLMDCWAFASSLYAACFETGMGFNLEEGTCANMVLRKGK